MSLLQIVDDSDVPDRPRRSQPNRERIYVKRPPHYRSFLAIDGEGLNDDETRTARYGNKTIEFNHQRYVLMVGSNEDGTYQPTLSNWTGEISTEQALRWIIDLPENYVLVGYSLGYVYTKILKDVPRKKLKKLFHPETSEDDDISPLVWWRGWGLRWLNGRLHVARGKRRRTIWDVFKFFQSRFTDALAAWVPEAVDDLKFIESMKAARGDLASIDYLQIE